MFTRPDNTYNDIREKSLMQWLDEMEQHSDVAVRGGVKLTREYVQHLQEEIRRLEEENQLKAQYLKKMKEKNWKGKLYIVAGKKNSKSSLDLS